MHPEILDDRQKSCLPLLAKFAESFCLVGGTAIAYHLGHRQSIDFDLFTAKPFNRDALARTIRSFAPIERVFIDDADEYTVLAQGIRLTFLRYPFPLEHPDSFENAIPMPNLLTLGAMKLFALGRRAKWKDYVDLFFILKDRHSLPELLAQAKAIFGAEMNEKILREELSYFDDIDYSESVSYLPGFETPDKTIQEFLTRVSIS